jgi:hypothetical protein
MATACRDAHDGSSSGSGSSPPPRRPGLGARADPAAATVATDRGSRVEKRQSTDPCPNPSLRTALRSYLLDTMTTLRMRCSLSGMWLSSIGELGRVVNLNGVDLNLLAAFDALLAERSVISAAERLCLGQPAMSAALGRLRKLFDDPLLARVGSEFLPTPLAETLVRPVREAIVAIHPVLAVRGEFDPALDHRTFTVIASDYVGLVPLRPRLQRDRAPAAFTPAARAGRRSCSSRRCQPGPASRGGLAAAGAGRRQHKAVGVASSRTTVSARAMVSGADRR